MPPVCFHRRLVAPVLVGALALATSVSSGVAGSAIAATCPPPPSPVQPFLSWSDTNDYVLTTGGAFESGSPMWTLSGGATVVNDQAPDPLAGARASRALLLPSGGSATSACVTAPQIVGLVRFFAKNVGAADGQLRVEVLVKGKVYQAGMVSAGASWAPTPILDSGAPIYKGAVTYQVRLTSVGTGAEFAVDDVYFDPFHSR
jgi:hypothetical protein